MLLSGETIVQLNITNGFLAFIQEIAGQAKCWGENVASSFQRTAVSEKLGLDVRTVTRYMKDIETKGLGQVQSKRGRNGGTVVVFNQDVLHFDIVDNPMSSETKEADAIRDYFYPRTKKAEPLRKYRTKQEISHDALLSRARKDKEWQLNEELNAMPHVTRAFFNNFDEPELYYRAYLTSRAYNAYASIYPRERMAYHLQQGDTRLAKFNKKAVEFAKKWDVMPRRFVGSSEYKVFVQLQRTLDERNINPLSYLTTQFEYVTFLAEHKKARRNAIPYVNSLISQEAMDRYNSQARYYRHVRNRYHDRSLSKEEVLFNGAKYPIIQALLWAFEGVAMKPLVQTRLSELILDAYTAQIRDPELDGLELTQEDVYYNHHVIKAQKLVELYMRVNEDLLQSEIAEEHKQLIVQYLEDQIVLHAKPDSLSTAQYMLTYPVQLHSIREALVQSEADLERYYGYIGNPSRDYVTTEEEVEHCITQGELIDFSLDGADTFREVGRMLAHDMELGSDTWKLKEALQAYGLEKLPINSFGMLDMTQLTQL